MDWDHCLQYYSILGFKEISWQTGSLHSPRPKDSVFQLKQDIEHGKSDMLQVLNIHLVQLCLHTVTVANSQTTKC